MSDLRLPPWDEEAEEACIGAALVDPEAVEALDFVRPEMFFREKNGWVWGAIRDVASKGDGGVNSVTVASRLAELQRLDGIGGQSWLADIIRRLPTSVGAEWYGRIVEDRWQRRRLISVNQRAIDALYDTGTSGPSEIAGQLVERLLRLGADRARPLTRSIGDVLRAGVDGGPETGLAARIDEVLEAPAGTVMGYRTGWPELDSMLGGLQPSRVYTVLAATSIGKSWFVQFIAWSLATAGVPCLVVTTEMSADEVGERLVFMEAGIDRQWLQRREATEDEVERIHAASADALNWPLYICDVGQIALPTLVTEVRRQRAQNGIRVVLLDHIQHVQAPGVRDDVARLGAVTSATKALAVNEYVPVVQVSHVNRQAMKEGWVDMNSARGSATIEQDSNVVIALNQLVEVDGEWIPPTDRRVADVWKDKRGWIAVHLSVEKNRAGGQGGLRRALSWNTGGRFVPLWEVE